MLVHREYDPVRAGPVFKSSSLCRRFTHSAWSAYHNPRTDHFGGEVPCSGLVRVLVFVCCAGRQDREQQNKEEGASNVNYHLNKRLKLLPRRNQSFPFFPRADTFILFP